MVYLKVSDGTETRKFQVNPSDVTFNQLKERLTSFFPTALSGQSDLSLQYRDKEGDFITLSSNQELQEALSQLPEEAVWKLHIKNNPHTHKTYRPTQQQQQRQRRCHDVSPFEPAWRPFGLFSNPWATFDRELSETLQLARILENHFFQSPEKGEEKKDTAATTRTSNKEATNSENGATENRETKSSEEDHDEVVKSKPEESAKKTTVEKSDDTSHPHVRHWGVWEPRVFVSPFGFRTVVGPVGYSIRWGPQTHDGGCSGGVCGGKKEEKKEETVNSPTEKKSENQTSEKATETQASPEHEAEATTVSE